MKKKLLTRNSMIFFLGLGDYLTYVAIIIFI